MKSQYLILSVFVSLFFSACGGGGGSSSNNTSTSVYSGYLIDSALSNVDYTCGSTTSTTTSEGKFTCNEGSSVNFYIGGINLGSYLVSSNEEKVTPAKLYDLALDDVSDTRLINFIRLVQSLDEDSNPNNGINISETSKASLENVSLDISDSSTTESEISTLLSNISISLVSSSDALSHYTSVLNEEFDISIGAYKNEPLISQQWAILENESFYNDNNINTEANIHPGSVYDTYTGSGVTIAIIDNGFDVDHEDLKAGVESTYDLNTGTTDVSHNQDDELHGTAVSGIAAARQNSLGIKGIASSAKLILIKYKEDDMTDSEFIALFDKAEELGADIINCSWGTGFVSSAVKAKIQDLATNGRDGKGISIVFSSGNDNSNMRNDESNIEEVISVGATNKSNQRTSYSDYGENLDIVAPGGEYLGITTLDVTGTNGGSSDDYLEYDYANAFVGTSASAPIVSGIIALMLEKDPDLTRVEIENLLKENADKIGNLTYDSNGRNDYYGYGKVNLQAVINSIQ